MRRAQPLPTAQSNTGFPWVESDGGRLSDGWDDPDVLDCGVRALAHATGRGYAVVRAQTEAVLSARRGRKARDPEHVELGLRRTTLGQVLGDAWVWVPTHKNSPAYSGDTVRFRPGDLPSAGRILVSIRGHFCAVIDGVIYDTFDPTYNDPVVYGYFVENPVLAVHDNLREA